MSNYKITYMVDSGFDTIIISARTIRDAIISFEIDYPFAQLLQIKLVE